MLTYEITEADHCRPVESFLRNLLPAAPLSYLKKLVRSGHFTVNGGAAMSGAILRLGDIAALKESVRTRELLADGKPELEILHEDQWIVMFNKPPGMPLHRAAEVDAWNLVDVGSAFLAHLGEPVSLRPVNRLDRGTSGVVVMAKSSTAAGMFGRMVKEEGLGKLYLAVVEGKVPHEGSITAALDGKESETRFRLLFQGKDGALVAAYPVTGRTHQIRRHFRLIGHPVRGDARYGGRPLPGVAGHLLHSFRTSLTHPATGETLIVHAPLPEGFLSLLKELAGDFYLSVLGELSQMPNEP